jgi:hypothetical protein
MWEKPTMYAVKKVGNKRATRVFETYEEADLAANVSHGGEKYEIEIRPGERTRCESYCLARDFCKQYQEYVNQKEEV